MTDNLPRRPRRSWARLLALALGLALLSGTAQAQAGAASDLVERLNGALEAAMRGGEGLSFDARRAGLAPVVRAVFDLPFIARVSLGRHARELSDDDLEGFVHAFSSMVISTYASRFKRHDGERFEIVSERELKPGRWLVRTHIVEPDGSTTNLDYVIQAAASGGRLAIVNVVAEGVSDLSLRRAEYDAVIQRDGFAGLLEKLETQGAALRQ